MLKKEILRKSIHMAGIAYIPAVIFLGKDIMSYAVIILTLSAILLELIRKRRRFLINYLLRDYEKKRVPGYIYTGVAFSIITPLLSTEACIVSAITAFAGDGTAGIAKRVKPELAIPSFILPCLILILFLPVNLIPAVTSIAISSIFDGRRWEDNLTIPISAGLIYEITKFVSL